MAPRRRSTGAKTADRPATSSGQHTSFAHPSEAGFAQILDFYGLRWEYEPRSFALDWDGDRVAEMLTPDFFLPDLDLYVELTTLKQTPGHREEPQAPPASRALPRRKHQAPLPARLPPPSGQVRVRPPR